jgi:hypothetical protein
MEKANELIVIGGVAIFCIHYKEFSIDPIVKSTSPSPCLQLTKRNRVKQLR